MLCSCLFSLLFLCFDFLLLIDAIVSSTCSPYLYLIEIDITTNHEIVQPCPLEQPCQCLCEIETQRLWIDCFYRQLKIFPQFKEISTDKTILEWNIDLAFNQFKNLTSNSQWIPSNMHIHHLIFSGSLAYDLIVQLNLTHRHLIDLWPNHEHLKLVHEDEEKEKKTDDHEHTRLLTDLTFQLRQKTKLIEDFYLTLAGDLSSVSILYLDHNSLHSIPIIALYNATRLYELYLSYNHLQSLPAYAFGFSHHLTRLDLSHNQISSIDNHTFHRHPNAFAGPFLIDYLDLSHNQLINLTTNIFSYLVNLRLLKLEHNQIRHLSAYVWTGLYRLKYLDLSHNLIENMTQVFYSSYLNELKHLKITSNNLSQIGSCEFLSLKSLNKLDLSGNNLSDLDTCSFFGLPRQTSHSSLHIHLRSNQFQTLHPCTFNNFQHSTIHIENNPLICNCSFNYLLQERKSLAYTGQECRGGFAYQPQTQFALPAIRKTNQKSGKKFANKSLTCRNTYKYYNNLCSKLDCTDLCIPNERLIIQITTIATPNCVSTNFQRIYLSFMYFFVIINQIVYFFLFT